ncbi:MAG: transglutaminase family protein [Polyangiaceae bacterium]|nr:transglutaminase family protein [Polyangiaceae bacterium]
MRLLFQHRSRYGYPTPTRLGPHTLRLRPTAHARARVETYRLHVEPAHRLRWQQDPYGNHVARIDFEPEAAITSLEVLVEMAIDVRPVNPFDFLLEGYAERVPFAYPAELRRELAPFLSLDDPAYAAGDRFDAFDAELPREGGAIGLVAALNQAVNQRVRYVIRDEAGVYTPEICLREGRASCRDSAALLVALLRRRGLAARFASGYLIQLVDEGMLPDRPRGVARDVADLHAWCEVYLPGAGWVGLDATSGLLCGEGHVPLCCASTPALASPIEGTSEVVANEVRFSMSVGRLGHEARPTAPYADETWGALIEAGDRVDEALRAAGVVLTVGGEPTFNSREHADEAEWNGEALGPTKWTQGLRLATELQRRLAPGSALLLRQGKWYPGEPLPRWALEIVGRRDRAPLWPDRPGLAAGGGDAARRFVGALAAALGVSEGLQPAFEDPWRLLQDEAKVPAEVDAASAGPNAPADRRRLARLLSREAGAPAGWVLPLATDENGRWVTERWAFRRGALYLVPGDSPLGLRLPLDSLTAAPAPQPIEPVVTPPDPRRAAGAAEAAQAHAIVRGRPTSPLAADVRTALCVEEREGVLHAFLPPLPSFARFCQLVDAVDAARVTTGLDVRLEGYAPPASPDAFRFAVTPDPGVLEVNVPPCASTAEARTLADEVFDAALHAGLHAEKYLLDGRMAGSGGGNHVTLGGPSPLESPFVRRPELLASLLVFLQHHPSLAYLFSGLFVGPTSQAPRVDEARHDALYELEIALARAFEPGPDPPPWLGDLLFRHLLVDLTGNGHRTELSIDKLFGPGLADARQGLVELRAFEMPPHPRMIVAQITLARALVASFARAPYRGPLVRWGQALHDRFLLPHALWSDFEGVLAHLAASGLPLPAEGYRPFLELRCPLIGRLQAGDVTLEVRNALEPWPVLGEQITSTGTARYVDSSVERVEVLASGLVPERHLVSVNGHALPMRPTAVAGTFVAGVRFRAWAPPHGLHPHIGVHHPVRFDVVDAWARRSLGGCAYHVWHPEGRAFDSPPLTRFEASARRAQRFTLDGPRPHPAEVAPAAAHPDAPWTLDLRRLPGDHPPPRAASAEPAP